MPKETKVIQKCRETLRAVFGHEDYREGQEAIIEALLEGRDVLAVLPTGAGKSLCFQLPALVKDGMAVVFEPLISLMKDQVDALKKKNVAAAYLSSNMEWDEISSTVELIRDEKIKILYVSPERLSNPFFCRLLEDSRVSLFAYDEAHCVSSWGHDFRPEYRLLSALKERFPSIRELLLRQPQMPLVHEISVKNFWLNLMCMLPALREKISELLLSAESGAMNSFWPLSKKSMPEKAASFTRALELKRKRYVPFSQRKELIAFVIMPG